MHRVMWGIHRTSLCAIRVAKRIMVRFGLTPSRFHLLFAMRSEGVSWFPQKGLKVLMGVSAQNVSRMIRSLVKCGVLLQRVVPEDRRRRVLAFTEHGKAMMGRAVGEVVLSGLGTHVAGRALTDLGWPCKREERHAAVEHFHGLLNELRCGLRDRAIFEYQPEDGEPEPVYFDFWHASLDVEDSTPDLTAMDRSDDAKDEWSS